MGIVVRSVQVFLSSRSKFSLLSQVNVHHTWLYQRRTITSTSLFDVFSASSSANLNGLRRKTCLLNQLLITLTSPSVPTCPLHPAKLPDDFFETVSIEHNASICSVAVLLNTTNFPPGTTNIITAHYPTNNCHNAYILLWAGHRNFFRKHTRFSRLQFSQSHAMKNDCALWSSTSADRPGRQRIFLH